MTPQEQEAALAIAIHAALADGAKNEREEARRVAASLADESNAPDLSSLYGDVLLKRPPLAAVF